MDSSPDRLSPLQRDLLKEFFARESGFFLTGGAALAGFFLKHRQTDDLDLFTEEEEAFERAPFALAAAAEALGASMEARQQAQGFHRYVLTRGPESVVVDLVLDRVPQVHVDKLDCEGVRVDPPAEILVNKLNTIASRSEVRDLVDVMTLERSGLRVEDALEGALAKDGGCTPGTLAWVLSQIEIPPSLELPGDVSGEELCSFLDDLIRRLRHLAAPEDFLERARGG